MVDAIDALRFSLNNDLYKLNTISQNLANVSTSGYKRELPTFSQYDPATYTDRLHASDAQRFQQIKHKDFSQSTLKYTANLADISIDGDGFFVVEKDGTEYATRVGTLRVNNEGKLVGAHNEFFVGQSGSIQLEPGEFEIDEVGVITQNGRAIDKLVMVNAVDTSAYFGNGFYGLDFRSSTEPLSNVKVRQGFLETSNVKTMDEMVKLIETTRHFESVHGVLKAYDDVMNLAINKLAEF
jgi:flagellar basal body rod protein FlgG